jgi:beta-glucosidase
VVYEALGDKVQLWITHNEPWVIAFGGHYFGILAPGIQDLKTTLQVSHHLLLSHGMVVRTFRELADERMNVGIILNLTPIHPATKNAEDQQAMRRIDGYMHRWFLNPLFRGSYPDDMISFYGEMTPTIEPEDMGVISEEVDFLGVNYYTRLVVESFPEDPLLGARPIPMGGSQYTESGWEVYPHGLYEILRRLEDEYQPASLYITENGAAFPDLLDEKGQVKDLKRLKFLQDHFQEAHHSLREGAPLRGYFVWSLMDLFEWDSGYSHGYGLIHVDRKTLKRTVKESGLWYREFIREQHALREAR